MPILRRRGCSSLRGRSTVHGNSDAEVDGVTPLPPKVWELVEQVRDAVLMAIEECAPADCTYIFTNFVRDTAATDPTVQAYFDRLGALARSRDGALRFVALACEPEELYRRVAEPDRRARLKSIDSAWVRQLVAEEPIYVPDGPGAMHVDLTDLDPSAAAKTIADHVWR